MVYHFGHPSIHLLIVLFISSFIHPFIHSLCSFLQSLSFQTHLLWFWEKFEQLSKRLSPVHITVAIANVFNNGDVWPENENMRQINITSLQASTTTFDCVLGFFFQADNEFQYKMGWVEMAMGSLYGGQKVPEGRLFQDGHSFLVNIYICEVL